MSSDEQPLITFDEMKAALERAVAERGENYVYTRPGQTCLYRHEGDVPGCLVGLAMSYLRPDVRLEEEEAFFALRGHAEENAISLANWAQSYQDGGLSWGRSLAKALEKVHE